MQTVARVIFLCGVVLLQQSALNGQEQGFNCLEAEIKGSSNDNVIGNCVDTIELYFGAPIPPPRSGNWDNAARLLRVYTGSTGMDSLVDVPITITAAPMDGLLTLAAVADTLPIFEDGSEQVALYRVLINCATWFSNPNPAEARIGFTKSARVLVRSEARSVVTGELLDSANLSPSQTAVWVKLASKQVLAVHKAPNNTRFSHWTCNYPGIVFNPNLSYQSYLDNCWPVADTVVFTAWFQPITSVAEGASEMDLRFHQKGTSVIVEGLPSNVCTVTLLDALGRPVCTKEAQGKTSLILEGAVASGLYMIITVTERAMYNNSLIVLR